MKKIFPLESSLISMDKTMNMGESKRRAITDIEISKLLFSIPILSEFLEKE